MPFVFTGGHHSFSFVNGLKIIMKLSPKTPASARIFFRPLLRLCTRSACPDGAFGVATVPWPVSLHFDYLLLDRLSSSTSLLSSPAVLLDGSFVVFFFDVRVVLVIFYFSGKIMCAHLLSWCYDIVRTVESHFITEGVF
jgi:hypothetical protein